MFTSQVQHEQYSFTDWQHEVANGTTQLGYHEWVASLIETDEYEEPEYRSRGTGLDGGCGQGFEKYIGYSGY